MITLTIILIAIPIILIIALFTRKGITTEAAIDINQPQQQVFNYLTIIKNQEHYNAWLMIDPNMKITYTGTDGQAGAAMAWESKNKKDGIGSQRIVSANAPENIEIELVFEKPVPSKARYWLLLKSLNETSTRVTWRYEGNTAPYYLLRVSHLLLQLKKRVRKYMEASLSNLKSTLEHH
jgi:hypothetical protein